MGSSALLRMVVPRLLVRDRGISWSRIAGAGGGLVAVALGLLGVFPPASTPLWVVLGGLLAVTLLAAAVLAVGFATVVVGFGLAVACFVTTLAVFAGLETAVAVEVGRLDGHVTVSEYGLDFDEYRDVARQLRAMDGVQAVSPFAYAMVGLVRADATAVDRAVVALGKGLDPVWAQEFVGLSDLFVGGAPSAALRPADPGRLPGIALGARLAARLNAEPGATVTVVVQAEIDGRGGLPPPRHAQFEVTDLLRGHSAEVDDRLALLHLTAAQALFFREDRVTGVELQLVDAHDAPEVATRIESRLGPPFRAGTWMQRHEATLVGLSQLRVACSAVLGLLGLVAGAGVVIALHVTVRRRRRELVLLTALGATWGQVFSTLQATGLVACALGVAAGLGLGLSWCSALERAKVALDPTVFPVDHLPLVLRGGDVFGITIAAWVVAACAVGPVAAAAVRRVVVQGFRE